MSTNTPETASKVAFDLKLENIVQRYRGTPAAAVDGVSLQIEAGELVALLGPSGCGKTTLLRIIAGFVQQTSGQVLVGGRAIDELPPHRREVGVVFQNYALFPHMNAGENVGYGLACRGASRADQTRRAKEMLELVRMGHLADRLPREMSGGQQQRVALARVLAVSPRILLLDEPFAALDKGLRLDMQIEVKRIQRLAGITCIMVTHDQEEALSMADRVAVINQGRLEQFDIPNNVYDKPASLFVNQFVGAANLLSGRLELSTDSSPMVALDAGPTIAVRTPLAGLANGAAVQVCIRPEHLRLSESGADTGAGANLDIRTGNAADDWRGTGGVLRGTIELSLPLGPQIIHEVRLANGSAIKVVESRGEGARSRDPGSAVRLLLKPGATVSAFPQSASALPDSQLNPLRSVS